MVTLGIVLFIIGMLALFLGICGMTQFMGVPANDKDFAIGSVLGAIGVALIVAGLVVIA